MKESYNSDIYQKSIDVLTSQGKFYINLGLERVQAVLEILGNPQKNLKFIHVAGTNGKGSVCSMLSSILGNKVIVSSEELEVSSEFVALQRNLTNQSSDNSAKMTPNYEDYSLLTAHSSLLKVGLFTSPHVYEYTERIKINDIEIPKEDFAKNVLEVIEISEKNNVHLTEFEIITVVAFQYFAQNNVDIVVLETGLGGRLDATNVIENSICSVITHIDLDHTERLGDTIEKIAFEKAGIIKPTCPVVTSKNNAGLEIVKKVALEKKSDIFLAEEFSCHCEDASRFTLHASRLKGTYQKENIALVLRVIELLNQNGFNITQENIEEGLKNVRHPCRFEYLKDKNIIIDGAHNPNGTKALRESLDEFFPNQKFKFIFGCLNNKQYTQMMQNLFAQKDEIYFYEFDNPNSCSYEELALSCDFPSNPFREFKQDSNTLTVICGSFYMIKELLSKIDIK